MAPPSPRRSSRARATNPSQQSSVSSGASGRAERNTRQTKTSSGKSTPSASLSSEPLDDFEDTLLSRRRKRGLDDGPDKALQAESIGAAIGSDDAQDEEDEAVRCICGSEDYPGRPPVDGPDADFFASIELTEDVTGFFVQCDICKVWQHGACLGIFSAESSPDEYFCEQCRQDLHIISTASNGQKYSKYLPLHPISQASSRANSIVDDGAESPKGRESKDSRPTSSSHSYNKRRSTMNSRDAAYDDEQLLRAIKASREDTAPEGSESTTRRTKRGRSNSEDDAPAIKRQRTNSQSQSPAPEQQEVPTTEQSEDEANTRNIKKARNGRPVRERSEKEDPSKERHRQEAPDKRKGRVERRRGDDSDLAEEIPLAAAKQLPKPEEAPNIVETPPAPPPAPGTPPATLPTANSSHKRAARSTHKRGKGKNQSASTRDGEPDDSPARSMSRDIQKNGEEISAVYHVVKPAVVEPKPASRVKPAVASKMSMLDMRRRVAAIMDFISRTQVDLAAEGNLGQSSNSTSGQNSPQKTPAAQVNGTNGSLEVLNGVESSDKLFKELGCVEMMDILTRDMVKWQNQYL